MIACRSSSGWVDDTIPMMCMLYTAISLVWMLCRAVNSTRKPTTTSPIIKPVGYMDSDALLRRTLVAVNWSLVANKARALDGLNIKKHTLKKHSTSFTYGQDSFKVRPRRQST